MFPSVTVRLNIPIMVIGGVLVFKRLIGFMLLVILGAVGFSGMSVNAEKVEIKSFEEAY